MVNEDFLNPKFYYSLQFTKQDHFSPFDREKYDFMFKNKSMQQVQQVLSNGHKAELEAVLGSLDCQYISSTIQEASLSPEEIGRSIW